MRAVTALIALLAVALAAWSGFWWLGATAKRDAVEAWLAERRADGWAAAAEVSVAGYPNRFDMTVEDLTLADPEAGWAWSAPAFRTFMLAYRPNEIIAEWPGAHAISVPGERAEAAAERFRASAAFRPTTALELDRAVVEADGLTLAGAAGWSAAIGRAQLSVRRSEALEAAHAYDAVLDAREVAPPDAWRAVFGAGLGAALPARITRAALDVSAALRRPLDRRAVEESDLSPEVLVVNRSLIRWGPLGLEAEGRLEIAPDGTPEGRLQLTARNWRAMLAAAADAGVLAPGLAETLRAGLELLALLSEEDGALEAPLVFADGRVSLGPIPLGPAPRF